MGDGTVYNSKRQLIVGLVAGWISSAVVLLLFRPSSDVSQSGGYHFSLISYSNPGKDCSHCPCPAMISKDPCPACQACPRPEPCPACQVCPPCEAHPQELCQWDKGFPFNNIVSRRIPKYMNPKTTDVDGHAGGNYIGGNLYPTFWRYLKDRFAVTSALDVGCGLGESTKGLSDAGIQHVYAFDGFRENIVSSNEGVQYHDLNNGPFVIGKVVDLAWASEVLEHIDYQMLPNLMMSLLQAKVLAVNAAGPGQTGHHHVVLRTWPEFWIPLFETYGFVEIKDITENILQDEKYMKEANRGHMWWALSGHSPGRVLLNKNLDGCKSSVECFNKYLEALRRTKGIPAPKPGPKDPKQAEWERLNR